MAKRRKKAWNNTNPLYRYLHGSKKRAKARKVRKIRGVTMARRRRTSRRSSASKGGMLMNGLVHPKGIIGNAVMGAGAATLTENLLGGQVVPFQNAAVGFAVGGVPGAAGAIGRDMLKGMIGTQYKTTAYVG